MRCFFMIHKQLVLIPFLLTGFVACSTNPETVQAVSQTAEELKTTHNKSAKPRHKHHPEGVISVDVTNFDNRLHLLTGKNQQGKQTLWYQQSDDGGETWTLAHKILDDDNLPVKMTRGNDAQITAQGKNIVVTWTKFDKTRRFKAGAMLAARSNDNGKTWQYSAPPPDWGKGPHGYIDLAADTQAMHAVWLDSRNGKAGVKASQGLRYAKSIDGGLSWLTNQSLDELTCSCCWNTINTDEKGNAYVLYRDKQPSDLSIGIINTEQQWQRLNHVGTFNWQFDGCPHIGGGFDFQTTAGKDRMHAVVGTGHPEYFGIHYSYSDDAGKNWSSAKSLGDESATHSDIAAHDKGHVVTVWDMMTEDGLAVFYAESTDQGNNWSKPHQISKAGMRATHPNIVKTEKGFLIVWTENNGKKQTLATKIL